MNIRKVASSFLIFLFLFVFGCGYGEDDKETAIFISGTVDVGEIEEDISGPVLVAVLNTYDLEEIQENPDDTIIKFIAIDESDYTFLIDLTDEGVKEGDEIYVTAFVDNDYEGGIPFPTGGDKLGLLQNKETYAFSIELEYGVNHITAGDYKLELTKNVYDSHDFDYDSERGSIRYTLDDGGAGSYGPEAQFIIMAIHVGGVSINLSEGLDLRDVIQIDMDYILGVKVVPAAEYSEDPGNLNILPAIYEDIIVNLENDPPEPLIEGENYGTDAERTAYLVVILDKDGDGELDYAEDEIGYYCSEPTEIDLGAIDDILFRYLGILGIPDLENLAGLLCNIPTPIQRITKGENLDDTEPYAIKFYGLSPN